MVNPAIAAFCLAVITDDKVSRSARSAVRRGSSGEFPEATLHRFREQPQGAPRDGEAQKPLGAAVAPGSSRALPSPGSAGAAGAALS